VNTPVAELYANTLWLSLVKLTAARARVSVKYLLEASSVTFAVVGAVTVLYDISLLHLH